MKLSTQLAILAFFVQLVGWLERVKAVKTAEADIFRRLIAAARSEADAIQVDFDRAARRADDGLQPDHYERP